MSILGTRVARIEDRRLITTGGVYTDDLRLDELAGAAHLVLVRSPMAHARLASVSVDAARSAPGVVGVWTAGDLDGVGHVAPPARRVPAAMTKPLLATGTVRYVGEPVVAVLGETRALAVDAAELVEVEYEPLPAVLGAGNAAAEDAPLLFPEAGTNVALTFGRPVPDDAFAGCEVVVRQRLVNQRLAPVPLEGRAAAAAWGADGRATLWCSTQNAQAARAEVADWAGIDAERLRVVTPDVGGGFGAKIGADPEFALVVDLARRAGRPVRWTETRSETMTGMLHGRAQEQTVTLGGTRDGRVTAYALEVDQDCGAYPRLGTVLPSFTMMMLPGVYDVPVVHGQGRSVVTTTTPTGAYRGAGRPEATLAIERALDVFARRTGLDPVEVRRRNLIPPFDAPRANGSGATYDCGDYARALDLAVEACGYDDLRAEQARRRERGDAVQLGVGVACYVEITAGAGPRAEEAEITVHPDGTATVLTGTSPHGQGHATAWAMIVSERTGLPVDRVRVVHGDTDLIPRGGGTMGSRSLQTGGAAVHEVAAALVEEGRKRAADVLEADPSDLTVDPDGAGLVVAGTDRGVGWGELAAAEPLVVRATFTSDAPTFPFGAHVAVVEVDVETGKVRLRRIVTVDDAGRVVAPLLVEGQRHGGIAQGVAQALFEEVRYDEDGNPVTATLVDYTVPSAADLPSPELVPMETPTSMNPLGAKGIGESGTIGSTPAVLNAVIDAIAHLGVVHVDMPLTPQRVWRAIQDARPPA